MHCKYHVFKDSIVVTYKNKTFNIHRDDPRYPRVLTAIETDALDNIPAIADNEASENIKTLLKLGKRKTKKI